MEASTLDRHPYINLATYRRSGVAVKTPVWFAHRDGKLYVFSEASAGKMKRLRNNDAVQLAVCNVRGRVASGAEWIDGHARVVDDAKQIEAGYDALLRKYGWKMRLTNAVSRLSGRIDGRALIEIEIS